MIKLISPLDNSCISLNYKKIDSFIQKSYQNWVDDFNYGPIYDASNVMDYVDINKNLSLPKPVIFKFESDDKDDIYELTIINKDYKKSYLIKGNRISIYNLVPFEDYEWYITNKSSNERSETRRFVIINNYRYIFADMAFNIRDLGGKRTLDNKDINYGLVYRGIEIVKKGYTYPNPNSPIQCVKHGKTINEKGLKKLRELGIKTELDLRGEYESNFAKESALSSDDYFANYIRYSMSGYYSLFEDSSLMKKIIELFADINNYPIYFHCWGGADRTGVLSFILEAILNTKFIDQIIDYELTSFTGFNIRRYHPFESKIDPFYLENYNFSLMMEKLKQVKKENETINDVVIRLLKDNCGVSQNTIDSIRKIMLK